MDNMKHEKWCAIWTGQDLCNCSNKFGEKIHPLEIRAVEFEPIPMRIHCPECHTLHIDQPPWDEKPHHTHACQKCGNVWRPAIVNTIGVQFLPGFKNDVDDPTWESYQGPRAVVSKMNSDGSFGDSEPLHGSHQLRKDARAPSGYRCDLCDGGTYVALHSHCEVEK